MKDQLEFLLTFAGLALLNKTNLIWTRNGRYFSYSRRVKSLTPDIGRVACRCTCTCKVREIMRKIDSVALRWNKVESTCTWTECLWQLIHWRIVVHACIDGYTRLIIYLHCANNNLASTVLDLFKGGMRRHGLPSRTRSDHGLENVEVAI